MPFRFTPTNFAEVMIVEPRVFPDERGFFMEAYKRSDLAAHGITDTFVQINQSRSSKDTVRGLHYQKDPKSQGKLIRTLSGEVFDVVVDIRKGSPTYGEWLGVSLSSTNNRMLYVPRGFAHGFCVLSEQADILYMVTEEYAPECEAGIIWNDQDLGIDWPVAEPKLSIRDKEWPSFRAADNNFQYGPQSPSGILNAI
jgi:dTDP-4-dehydrorhamnose 3,5-epimerase